MQTQAAQKVTQYAAPRLHHGKHQLKVDHDSNDLSITIAT
jgi:hypothetical protein